MPWPDEVTAFRTETLTSKESGRSGADWIGAAPQEGLLHPNGQIPNTVMGQLVALYRRERTFPEATEAKKGVVKLNQAAATPGDPVVLGQNTSWLATHIQGLRIIWNSPTSITVESGSAWIPALGRVLDVPGAITRSSLFLTASTWHYVYLYSDAGTPAIETSTVAPAAYKGTARQKAWDESRRYLGAILTDSEGNLCAFERRGAFVRYAETHTNTPFRVVAGASTTLTNYSAVGVVPPTSRIAEVFLNANSSSLGRVYATGTSRQVAIAFANSGFAASIPLDSNRTFDVINDASGGTRG